MMRNFVQLRVNKDNDDIFKMTDRYIRAERITEVRVRVTRDSEQRYEVVLDTGEVAFLDWENNDAERDLFAILKS